LDRGEPFQPLERHSPVPAAKFKLKNEPRNRTGPRANIGRAELDAALKPPQSQFCDIDPEFLCVSLRQLIAVTKQLLSN
jgi:hypothetical protein